MPIPSMGGFLRNGHFTVVSPDEGVACIQKFFLVSLCHFSASFPGSSPIKILEKLLPCLVKTPSRVSIFDSSHVPIILAPANQ